MEKYENISVVINSVSEHRKRINVRYMYAHYMHSMDPEECR